VYRDLDDQGRETARKVFGSAGLTQFVQFVLLGAPNPYAWNEHAIECAVLRRRILAPLVGLWFGGRVRVARAWGRSWNEGALAFELSTELVDGRAPRLHRPGDRRGGHEVRELLEDVMRPLQGWLADAGFDGLVWQAGRGNPVALANFLFEGDREGRARWAWIDLESGVPALFPLDPRALLRFYLPRAWKFRRPLFDDVDVARLREYLDREGRTLRTRLGECVWSDLQRDATALRYHQEAWKSQPRVVRSIAAQFRKGRLGAARAAAYVRAPWRWYAHLAGRVPPQLARWTGRALRWTVARLREFPYRRSVRAVVRFCVSQRYRWLLARRFVSYRINAWQRRGQLAAAEARALRERLAGEESSAYLTDFAVHLAIKPVVKSAEFFVLPVLYLRGWIDEGTLAIGILVAGAAARTLYTLGRLVQSYLAGRERPWVALGAGLVPVLGNLAYPLQIVASSHVEEDRVAQFLLYDGCAALGRRIPIWGGRDTLLEHRFNHLPDLVVGGRR